MRIVIALCLIISFSAAASADSWWTWEEDQWCFRTSQNKACLPRDYRTTSIAPNRIKFVRSDPEVEPPGFVEFHFKLEHTPSPLSDEAFILSSKHASETVSMEKYISREQGGSSHLMTLFIITLDGKFTLLIYGSDDHAISNLAQALVKQWEKT